MKQKKLKKKWLWCGDCGKVTWAIQVDRVMFKCKSEEHKIHLLTAQKYQKELRYKKMVKSRRSAGTYKTKAEIQIEKDIKEGQRRTVDKRYLWWLHSFTCCIPGCHVWPVHAHHVERLSQGGSDRSAIPVCGKHHIQWIHGKGVRFCEELWKIEFGVFVLEYNEKYSRDEKGEFFYRLDEFKESQVIDEEGER